MSADDKDREPLPPSVWDPWRALAAWTPARIGLGRAGAAQRTAVQLAFQAAHAAARDAVHVPWNAAELQAALAMPSLVVASRVQDRRQYLLRPDLGRLLDPASEALLGAARRVPAGDDVVIAVSNGLSSEGIARHGVPLVQALVDSLGACGLTLAPLVLVPDGRVAIGDRIGRLIGARLVIIVVGERPGLSAADSVGLYLTLLTRDNHSDAERNCISNVHPPDGLDYHSAAARAAWLAQAALTRGYSGVRLKDESPGVPRVR